jgi:hypothetical protein
MEIKSQNKKTFKEPDTQSLFNMYEKVPIKATATLMQPLGNTWNNTKLSTLYFSPKNIQIIQNGIRAGVYYKSKNQYTIGLQKEDELLTVMRSVFLQHSKNLDNNITQQITELNQMVLNFCIEQIYGEVKGYLKYLDDSSSMQKPLSHPILPSEKNKEPLELKKWF